MARPQVAPARVLDQNDQWQGITEESWSQAAREMGKPVLKPTGTQLPVAGTVVEDELATMEETRAAITPRIDTYYARSIAPQWTNAAAETAAYLQGRGMSPGHPSGRKTWSLLEQLTKDMDLLRSKITFAYTGIGDPKTVTAPTRRIIQELRGSLAGYWPAPDRAIRALDGLESSLRDRAMEGGIFG